MSVRSSRRVLLFAIALSLLIHLMAARLTHWSIPTPVDVPERLTIARVTIVHLARRTPPPQTPKPQPVATPRHARKETVAPPRLNPRRGPGVLPATMAASPAPPTRPPPTPRPTRLPTPSVAGACVDPNAAAAVRSTPAPPDIPTSARENSKRGVAQIRVALSVTGAVTGAAVEASTGNGALDQIALEFAKGATYSPALAQCKAVAGSYLFRVKFTTP